MLGHSRYRAGRVRLRHVDLRLYWGRSITISVAPGRGTNSTFTHAKSYDATCCRCTSSKAMRAQGRGLADQGGTFLDPRATLSAACPSHRVDRCEESASDGVPHPHAHGCSGATNRSPALRPSPLAILWMASRLRFR